MSDSEPQTPDEPRNTPLRLGHEQFGIDLLTELATAVRTLQVAPQRSVE